MDSNTPLSSPKATSTKKRPSSDNSPENLWAENAYENKGKGAKALFLFALGLMAGLMAVNWWAEERLSTAASVLEPRLVTQRVVESCTSTSLVDFASAMNGGVAVPAASSPSFHGHLLVLLTQESLGGFNQLALVIDPDNSSGKCWAFEGREGYATIRLGKAVFPTRFALVHANVSCMQLLHYHTAPRDFSVYNVRGDLKSLLGAYRFELERTDFTRDTTQLFPCQHQYFLRSCDEPLHTVMLKVENNHGDANVTCVYQFRVHGLPL